MNNVSNPIGRSKGIPEPISKINKFTIKKCHKNCVQVV